jgi:hypothetical protein
MEQVKRARRAAAAQGAFGTAILERAVKPSLADRMMNV